MRISDWSSDVCSSDLDERQLAVVRDLLDRGAAVYGVLDAVVIVDDRLFGLVLGKLLADFGGRVGEAARGRVGHLLDPRDRPAEVGLGRAEHVALTRGKGGLGGVGGEIGRASCREGGCK